MVCKTTVSWANTAARLTPAYGTKVNGTGGEGVKTLKRTAKFRKIVDLKNPAGYELSEIDKMQLRAGRRWKVIYDRKGNAIRKKHGEAVYFRNNAEAKRAAEIRHFGLARAMWGKNMGQQPFGKIPAAVQDALSKSGDLNELDYNRVTYNEQPGINEATVENMATSVSQGMMQNIANSTDGRIQKMLDMQAAYLIKKLSREAGKL